MEPASVGVILAVLLPLALVAEGLFAALVWRLNGWETPRFLAPRPGDQSRGRPPGWGLIVVAWLVLTTLTVWFGYLAAFVALHALLFTFGTTAAWIGLIVFAVLLAATPLVWGLVILRRAGWPSARH